MRYFLFIAVASLMISGLSTMAYAEQETLGGQGIQHQDDARDTMKELERKGQEKVDQAKGEASAPTRAEEIQTQNKESINNKIDAMKEEVMGR